IRDRNVTGVQTCALPILNLKQLPYFIAIAETGSLSAAARRTGVSQPTISDYLHELEHELGTPLFERRQRRMLPTEAGAAYLQMEIGRASCMESMMLASVA